jgi:hypothetical protein
LSEPRGADAQLARLELGFQACQPGRLTGSKGNPDWKRSSGRGVSEAAAWSARRRSASSR